MKEIFFLAKYHYTKRQDKVDVFNWNESFTTLFKEGFDNCLPLYKWEPETDEIRIVSPEVLGLLLKKNNDNYLYDSKLKLLKIIKNINFSEQKLLVDSCSKLMGIKLSNSFDTSFKLAPNFKKN